jgi:hypothetical protein
LSSSTTGYIATGTASGGSTWVFNASVELLSSTQYFFYMDTAATPDLLLGNNDYAGGGEYVAGSTVDNFRSEGFDLNFTLSGTPSPGPLPGAGLLSYLVLGFGGAAAFRRRLRARATALLECMKPAARRLDLLSLRP